MSRNRTVYGNVAADEDGVSESAGAREPPQRQEGGGFRRNIQFVLVLVGFCMVVACISAAHASQQPVAAESQQPVAFTAAAATGSQQPAVAPAAAVASEAVGAARDLWIPPGAGSSSDAPAGQYIQTNALDNLPMWRLKTEFVGSKYGGWSYVPALLGKDSVVYSVGLGEDVSWDEGTIARHGCKVFGFDPTPKSTAFIEKRFAEGHLSSSTFRHTREGLAVEKGNLVFALPKNKDHVSMRAGAGDIGGGTISVPVNTLENWMLARGHQQLDILKIDIEGSEYAVLENWIARGFFPFRQLLVEFHHRYLPAQEQHRHAGVLEGLKRSGFVVVHDAKGQEISFYNPTIRGAA